MAKVKVAEVPGRGRGVVAAQPIAGGDVLLHESPLLLYLDARSASDICSHCTRPSASLLPCPSCHLAAFCSSSCASASSHTPFVCSAFNLLSRAHLDADAHTQARFLVAAYNLAAVSPLSFQQLLLLEGDAPVDDRIRLLHDFLLQCLPPSSPTWSPEFVASLLAKDQRNAFGLTAFASNPSERQVRAYAIYAQASFFNHDCLPNACRFDYIDKPGVGNTDIIIRSLHDVLEGSEVCISYFPVNWSFAERQRKLKEEYGFECTCERCKIEENWSPEDTGENEDCFSNDGEASDADEGMSTTEDVMDADGEESVDFPHAIFFVRYLCPNDGCGGTLAPLPPVQGVSTMMECNVCGKLRSEEEFLEEIEEHRTT